ncbi:MAG: hypothetical protein DRG78_04890 [Epsilonproteobacteria bacterium]|nr:MAG: hypothetical protein DRG78_04890 [Campylobacterota bacterium]
MNNIEKEKENRATYKADLLKITHGSLVLTKKNLALVLGKSVISIARDMQNSKGPHYIKEKNNNIMFPIEDVLDYLTNTTKNYN